MSSPINAIVVFPIIKIPKRRHTWVVCEPGAEEKYLVERAYLTIHPRGTVLYRPPTAKTIFNKREEALGCAFMLGAKHGFNTIDKTRKA